jgi:hypothetical protein
MEKTAGWLQRGSAVALTIMTIMAAGCGGGGGDGGGGSAATSAPSGTSGSGNHSPTISASPSTQAAVGSAYVLAPTVADADGDTLAFTVQNRPSWATFNTATGQLTGTPSAQHVGTYSDVLISVSDGASTAALPAFTITVAAAGTSAPVGGAGAVTLQWEAPTMTTAGTPLNGLTGFRIHFGTRADVLDNTIIVSNAGTLAYSVDNLPAGTYYFAVKAVDRSGTESALSNVQRLVVS